MLLRELFYIFEGYKEALIAFSNNADQAEVKNTIDQFKILVNKNQVKGNERNIDYWVKQGWEKFSTFVRNQINQPTKTQIKNKKVVGKSINLIDDNNWLIVIPLDKSASCFYGKDSSWCTTKQYANHFENYFYKRDVILIYCLHKSSGNMWAIAGHEKINQLELFDQQDHPITISEFNSQTGLNATDIFNLAAQRHSSTIAGSKTQFKSYDEILKTLLPNVHQRDESIEKMLDYMKDGYTCRRYVDQLVNNDQDVSGLPESIIRAVVGYMPDYLEYFPNASEKAKIDAVTSGAKALKYINNPSPKILDIALTNHDDAIKYIDDYNFRNQAIRTYPKAAAYFAAIINGKRYPELEDLIATDTSAAGQYLRVMKDPWPEAEAAILNHEVAIPIYVKDNLKGKPWKAGEDALLKNGDPYYMYEYAVATKTRFIQAEDKIIKDIPTAAQYAVDVLKERWPDIEDELYDMSPNEYDSLKEYAETFDWDDYMDHWPKFFERPTKYDDEDGYTRGRYYYDDDY